jgi:hypothetical protein
MRSKKKSNHNQMFIMAVALIVRKTRETGSLMKANLAVLASRCRAVNITPLIVGNYPDLVKLYRLVSVGKWPIHPNSSLILKFNSWREASIARLRYWIYACG